MAEPSFSFVSPWAASATFESLQSTVWADFSTSLFVAPRGLALSSLTMPFVFIVTRIWDQPNATSEGVVVLAELIVIVIVKVGPEFGERNLKTASCYTSYYNIHPCYWLV